MFPKSQLKFFENEVGYKYSSLYFVTSYILGTRYICSKYWYLYAYVLLLLLCRTCSNVRIYMEKLNLSILFIRKM